MFAKQNQESGFKTTVPLGIRLLKGNVKELGVDNALDDFGEEELKERASELNKSTAGGSSSGGGDDDSDDSEDIDSNDDE